MRLRRCPNKAFGRVESQDYRIDDEQTSDSEPGCYDWFGIGTPCMRLRRLASQGGVPEARQYQSQEGRDEGPDCRRKRVLWVRYLDPSTHKEDQTAESEAS